jgi:uncharacterized protein (TIGR02246 family)
MATATTPGTTTAPTPTQVAGEVLARLEAAWNAGDGNAFGAVYAPDASFVTIRGEHFVGQDTIAAGHAGIFGSIYAGSVNRMRLVRADVITPDVVRAVSVSTLDCPTGPLAGVHHATSTSVIARDDHDGAWRVVATHNTLAQL